jgi:hypothetical protein
VRCEITGYHRPVPLRFVWHHVFPAALGGLTEPGNLVQLCDGCHHNVHVLMWQLANGGCTVIHPNRHQFQLAARGYQAAVDAGAEHLISRDM